MGLQEGTDCTLLMGLKHALQQGAGWNWRDHTVSGGIMLQGAKIKVQRVGFMVQGVGFMIHGEGFTKPCLQPMASSS